jgi:hypothetical protein
MKVQNYVITDRQIASLSHALTNQCGAPYEGNERTIFQSPDSVGLRDASIAPHGAHDEGGFFYWDTWDATMCPDGSRFVWGSGTSTCEIVAEKHSDNVWLMTVSQDVEHDGYESSYWDVVRSVFTAFVFEPRVWIDDPKWPEIGSHAKVAIERERVYREHRWIAGDETPPTDAQYASGRVNDPQHTVSDDELLGAPLLEKIANQ